MLYKNIGFRKKILFLLLLLISALFIIYILADYFFIKELKTENKILYTDYAKYLTATLENDNLQKQKLFLKTIANYGVTILEDPKDDVLSCQIELGKFLCEFYKDKLLTDKGKSELIEKYFVSKQKISQYKNINKHVYWGIDKFNDISSDALLFTLDSLKILKDSNSTLIKSVFLKTINGLCIAYPAKTILDKKNDFYKFESMDKKLLENNESSGSAFINKNGNLILWSRFSSNIEPKFDFIIAAALDFRILMKKICDYAWKRNIEASVLIDEKGNVVFYKHKENITCLDSLIAVGENLYTVGQDRLAKKDEHVNMLRNNQDGFFRFTSKNNDFYAGFSTLKDLNWKLLFITSGDDITSMLTEIESNLELENTHYISKLEKQAFDIQGILFLILVIVFIVFIIISLSLSGKLTKSLSILSKGVEKITGGNLAYRIPIIKTGDEIEKLIRAFNSMVDSINKYIKDLAKTIKEKQEVESDIKIAANIQKTMLPEDFIIPNEINKIKLEIASILIPSKTISGDFYDYFLIDNENLFFTIGDVSGKGVPASLFTVTIRTLLKEFIILEKDKSLEKILTHLNNSIARDNYSCMFATLFCGILNLRTGNIKYGLAGHEMPVIYREQTHVIEKIKKPKSLILGAFKNKAKFHYGETVLNTNDFLILFTDGVTETVDAQNKMLGRPGLEKFIEKLNINSPDLIIKSIIDKINFVRSESSAESDDITLLVIKRNG